MSEVESVTTWSCSKCARADSLCGSDYSDIGGYARCVRRRGHPGQHVGWDTGDVDREVRWDAHFAPDEDEDGGVMFWTTPSGWRGVK